MLITGFDEISHFGAARSAKDHAQSRTADDKVRSTFSTAIAKR